MYRGQYRSPKCCKFKETLTDLRSHYSKNNWVTDISKDKVYSFIPRL